MQPGFSEFGRGLCGLPGGVGGTHLRQDRILAMHAHLRRGVHGVASLDRCEIIQLHWPAGQYAI